VCTSHQHSINHHGKTLTINILNDWQGIKQQWKAIAFAIEKTVMAA
jgi:hypothetical protein